MLVTASKDTTSGIADVVSGMVESTKKRDLGRAEYSAGKLSLHKTNIELKEKELQLKKDNAKEDMSLRTRELDFKETSQTNQHTLDRMKALTDALAIAITRCTEEIERATDETVKKRLLVKLDKLNDREMELLLNA